MALVDIDDDLIAVAEAIRPVLLRASRLLRREAHLAGVSVSDAQLLGLIRKNPGVGVSELAEIEQISPPSISAHLKRLAAAGWIARDPAPPEDRRRVGVRVTAAGDAALDEIRRQRNEWLAARLAGLTVKDRRAIAMAADPLRRMAS